MNQRSLSHELTVLPTRPRPPSSFTEGNWNHKLSITCSFITSPMQKFSAQFFIRNDKTFFLRKKSLLKGIQWNAFWQLEKVFEMISSRLKSEFLLFLWSRGKINGCHVSWLLIGWISYQVILSIWSHQQLKWIFCQQCININSDLGFVNQSWSSTPT